MSPSPCRAVRPECPSPARSAARGLRALDDVDAHAAAGALDLVDRAFEIEAVEVGHFQLGDFLDLRHGDLADLGLVWLGRAFRQVDGAFDQNRHGRRLGNKSERPVAEDGNHYRNNQTFLILGGGLGVERLAELHDVDALRTQRGADRRRRSRLAGGDLQLNLRGNFLCHYVLKPTSSRFEGNLNPPALTGQKWSPSRGPYFSPD